jgi:hypothetical protein
MLQDNKSVELTCTNGYFIKSVWSFLLLTGIIIFPAFTINLREIQLMMTVILLMSFAYRLPKTIAVLQRSIIFAPDSLYISADKTNAIIPWNSIEAVKYNNFRIINCYVIYSSEGRYTFPCVGFDLEKIQALFSRYLDPAKLDPSTYKQSTCYQAWKAEILRQVTEREKPIKVFTNASHMVLAPFIFLIGLIIFIYSIFQGRELEGLAYFGLFNIGLSILLVVVCLTWIQADQHSVSYESLYRRNQMEWNDMRIAYQQKFGISIQLASDENEVLLPLSSVFWGKDIKLLYNLLSIKLDEKGLEPIEKFMWVGRYYH